MDERGRWVTPYVRLHGAHSLSGKALGEVAQEVLSCGVAFRFLALGGSMRPFIRGGDIITLAPFDPTACSIGDVVAIVRPENGCLMVHRVVSVAGDRCRIQGDNNSDADGEYLYESVVGTVTRVERSGRAIRFGLGPERFLIAILSRERWLPRCVSTAKSVYSTIRQFTGGIHE